MLTDTNRLLTYPFWQHTARLIINRCQVFCHEKWTAIFVPLTAQSGLDQVHFVWGAVYAMEVLTIVFPVKHIIMMDSDAAPNCPVRYLAPR